ncbi:MAG: valine--tRNA ligase [Parcubacteria group bacterium]|nr:valine--tRNA ligase [Parcubacteria group bacterium]
MELEKRYSPKEVEGRISKLWERGGFSNPDTCLKKGISANTARPFSIVLPPPNVTGTLHMGHAVMLAVEDILVRFRRMQGFRTLWVPGTDHAAIATQARVEQDLYKKEKKTRHDLGRESFLKRVEDFAQASHDIIVNQIKKMGASVDWSREAYTLDEPRSIAVREAFKRMYDMGIIYRGNRVVNWDPAMQTTVSDDEIEWKEEQNPFYYLKYGPFVIGTSRPETKFGDKYVVMHPDDTRYQEYRHGQKIELEWINGKVTATIIKDDSIDMEFGTGVMTITPWHDRTDFEIAERNKLDKEQIIDEKGLLLPIAGEFAGLHIKKARPLIVKKLEQKGLLVKVDEKYIHRVATNSRGGGIIEPQIMKQWFVDVNKEFSFPHAKLPGIKEGEHVTLKKLMLHVVQNKEISILPERFEKIYYHWIENLRDWCISRQIWYGHQIPVWYRNENIYVGIQPPKEEGWVQDPDTLDTWFSSGLWTFSTLGWPENTEDLKKYHPTSILETGYDILFFWVARMILMSTYLLGEVPFRTVYLHGLVRDERGRKMSKSLGNIIDPLDMIEKYGADATRLSLIIGAAPGNDMKLSEDKVRGYRNFVNKIWNIARFVLMQVEGVPAKAELSEDDKKILEDFAKVAKQATASLEAFRLSEAADTLYHYLWHTFADNVLEESKPVLQNPKTAASRQYVLLSVLLDSLKLLHPFVPFVTEEIYRLLPIKDKKESLMIERWPVQQ